ncbi:hypothetical protein J6590_104206 [Homalodisca vitripennis]|nr:hypothetical protein J6590_104206 [Homalodisca vitripennis]
MRLHIQGVMVGVPETGNSHNPIAGLPYCLSYLCISFPFEPFMPLLSHIFPPATEAIKRRQARGSVALRSDLLQASTSTNLDKGLSFNFDLFERPLQPTRASLFALISTVSPS